MGNPRILAGSGNTDDPWPRGHSDTDQLAGDRAPPPTPGGHRRRLEYKERRSFRYWTESGFFSDDKPRVPALTDAACRAEQEGGRSAVVTVSAHDVGSTPTLTPAGMTQGTEGPLGVTLACCGIKHGERRKMHHVTQTQPASC